MQKVREMAVKRWRRRFLATKKEKQLERRAD
jgi:hypothetical protein